MRNTYAAILHQNEYWGLAGIGVAASSNVIFAINANARKNSGAITVSATPTTVQHDDNSRDVDFDKLNIVDIDRFDEISYYGAG